MPLKLKFLFVLLLLSGKTILAQPEATERNDLIDILLRSNKDLFNKVLSNPEKYEVQILYTQIDRNKKNIPSFTSYEYRLDAGNYFYPASTVKLPAIALALEKLNQLQIKGLNKYTPLRIDSAYSRQAMVRQDKSAPDGLPSIAHYIKKILLVSNNDAYNRLYEFVGQQQMNEGFYKKGFTDLRLIKRLSVGSTAQEDRYTNPFTFYEGKNIIYQQPLAYNPVEYPNKLTTTTRGKGYIRGEILVKEPMDFSALNYISIANLQGILKSLLFPGAVPVQQRFQLTADDYHFLYKYMSMYPEESDVPEYDSSFYNSYGKFLMYGDTKKDIPANIRIFNKAGWAYGYMTDNAYIVDFENKVEFMLTATIFVNDNEIFNDDKYEYEDVGLPFMANLGRVVYEYELGRPKKFEPNLEKFQINYKD
jgi:hypothetical protein